MNSRAIRPVVTAIAGTLASATTKEDLTASYADIGSAVDINGCTDIMLDLAEIANVENAVAKVFLSMERAVPTASTGLYQLVNADGTEKEITITKNTRQIYEMPGAGTHLFLQAKGAAGTDGDLRAFVCRNQRMTGMRSRYLFTKTAIASTAVAVGATATAVGSVIDIRGLGNLTLFVQNSDGAVDGVITPYFSHADTQPAAYTNMFALKDTTPAARTFTTIANEKAAHFIGNVAADWLALSATGNGADLTVYLMATVNGSLG